MSNLPAIQDHTLSLDPAIRRQLTTWEDFISFWIQLEEASNSVSWIKADLLLELFKRFGEGSQKQFAAQVSEHESTVNNYIRVARAFPPATRQANASFSLHFQAMAADSYDDGKEEFLSNRRFEYIEKAVEENMSTRKLQDQIKRDKKAEGLAVKILPCTRCGKDDGDILRCVMYIFGSRAEAVRMELHRDCFQEVIAFATQAEANRHEVSPQ